MNVRIDALLETVRQLQDTIVQEYNPSSVLVDEEAEKSKQRTREQQARPILKGVSLATSIRSVHLYVKKTKALLSEDFEQNAGRWVFSLTYRSILRTIQVDGTATSKKEAKKVAALALSARLGRDTSG